MTTHAYIPLYVDDYDAATAHLSPEEDGIYMRLLRLCWRTPGCSLPNEPAWIARKIRLSTEDFDRIAAPVIAEFFKAQRGRLVQTRLKAEYENISRKKLSRQNAGKLGGTAKAAKTKDKSHSNAIVLLPDTRAFPNPYPEPEKSSEDKSSGAETAERVNYDKLAWDEAVEALTVNGAMQPKAARSLFGKLLSENGLEARDMLPAIAHALVKETQDPAAYLRKSAEGIARRRIDREPKRVGFV